MPRRESAGRNMGKIHAAAGITDAATLYSKRARCRPLPHCPWGNTDSTSGVPKAGGPYRLRLHRRRTLHRVHTNTMPAVPANARDRLSGTGVDENAATRKSSSSRRDPLAAATTFRIEQSLVAERPPSIRCALNEIPEHPLLVTITPTAARTRRPGGRWSPVRRYHGPGNGSVRGTGEAEHRIGIPESPRRGTTSHPGASTGRYRRHSRRR